MLSVRFAAILIKIFGVKFSEGLHFGAFHYLSRYILSVASGSGGRLIYIIIVWVGSMGVCYHACYIIIYN